MPLKELAKPMQSQVGCTDDVPEVNFGALVIYARSCDNCTSKHPCRKHREIMIGDATRRFAETNGMSLGESTMTQRAPIDEGPNALGRIAGLLLPVGTNTSPVKLTPSSASGSSDAYRLAA